MLTLERLEVHLAETGIWPADGRVVVGYSGGADSTALVHLLAASGHDFVAAHLHHGMRDEAAKELELCAAFCSTLGVAFTSGHADVPALARDERVGLEEAGRLARYTFLRQAAAKLDCVRIATAHTRTDHIETVMMHVIRGSGRRGLGGIAAESGDIIRPLLPFDRTETLAYCEENGLWVLNDPANEDDRFMRSRLRNRVFPILRELNPSLDSAVARLADVMREEDAFLDGATAAALERLEAPLNAHLGFLTQDIEVALDLPHFRHLPIALIRRGIRLCFQTLGGELDFSQTETILTGIASHSIGSITGEGGQVVAEWTPDTLHIRKLQEPQRFEAEVPIPGRVDAPELGWQLEISDEPADGQASERNGLTVWLDRATLALPVMIRGILPGDKVRPLGFSGTRKVAVLYSEARLTQAARQRVPVLADENGAIWVPGITLDERVRVNLASKDVLKLVFGPASAKYSDSN